MENRRTAIPTYGWIGIAMLIYGLRDVIGLGIPDIIFTGLFSLAFLILPIEDGLSLFIFSSVLTLPAHEIRLVYILIYVLKKRGNLNFPSTATLTTFGFVILQLVDMFVYSKQGIGNIIYTFVTFSLYLIIPFLWCGVNYSREKLLEAIKAYVIGIVFVGLITIYITVTNVGWGVLLSGSNSLGRILVSGNKSMITSNNRNALGVSMATALAYLIILLEKRDIRKVPALIAIVLCAIVAILTRSRAAFVCLGIIVAFWSILAATNKGHRRSAIAILVFIILSLVLINRYLPSIWNGVVDRFINQDDISNGRVDINSQYLRYWTSDWKCFIFGYGALTYSEVVSVFNSPHNLFVDVLISWGLVGLILLITFLISIYKKSMRIVSKENRKYGYLLLAVSLFGLMLDQYLTVPLKHLQFCFLLISLGMLDLENSEHQFIGEKKN